MGDVREELVGVLRRTAEHLRASGLPGETVERLETLAGQVHQPCVVAVVGRVKAGKSTFVNALLGEDLAKVGTTETTATINYFVYGERNPERPVRCHWRGGKVTDESRRFLDGLQGNDLETLRQAEGIAYLEYFLPNPLLKQITLVDTPGTGAVVDEHENRTAEFMRLNSRLRERHDEDTRRLGDTADAVIYLVGQVAKATDRDFLQEFARTTGGRSSALNAIGLLSKIELQPEVLRRRHELGAKIAAQLGDGLNTVIPVAAGVRRALDETLAGEALSNLIRTLRTIPPDTLEMLLDDPEFFRDLDFPDCPVSPAERRNLMSDMKWGVFATVARVAADPDIDPGEVAGRLEDLTGFGPLREVLNRHFLERGYILRCHRIADDARRVLNEVRYVHLPELRKGTAEDRDRLQRFVSVIHGSHHDPDAARELEDFVRGQLDGGRRAGRLESLHAELDAELSALLGTLAEANEDFEVLQRLEGEDGETFTSAELAELRPLMGLYGGELDVRLPPGAANADYVAWRQLYWSRRRTETAYGSTEHLVAERAYTRYGLVLEEILDRA
jgi:hypothetical protein